MNNCRCFSINDIQITYNGLCLSLWDDANNNIHTKLINFLNISIYIFIFGTGMEMSHLSI